MPEQKESKSFSMIHGPEPGLLFLTGTKVASANRTAETMFGVETNTGLKGMGVEELFAPPSCHELLQAISGNGDLPAGKRNGEPVFDLQGRLCDGRGPWFRTVLMPVPGGGTCTHLLILSQNQTPPGPDKFHNLVDHSIQGVVVQRRGVPLYANKSFATIFGYESPEEILRLGTLEPTIAPEMKSQLKEFGQARLRGEDVPANYRGAGIKKDGTRIWVEAWIRVEDWEGEPAIHTSIVDVTEQVRVEQEIREAEERFRAVIDNAPIVVWALNREEIFTFSQGGGLSALGLRPGQVVGQSLADIYRDHEDILAYNRRALQGDVIESLLEVGALSYEIHIAPRRDADGEIIGTLGVAYDISKRIKAEKALKENQRLLRMVFDHIPHIMFVQDAQNQYQMVNLAFTRFHGITENEIKGRSLPLEEIATGSKQDLDKIHAMDREILRTQTPAIVSEIELTGTRGDVRKLRVHKVPLHNDQGGFSGILGLAEDITERRRVEQALEENRRLLQMVFDNIPHLFMLKDADGRYRMINQVTADFFSLSVEEILGKTLLEVFQNIGNVQPALIESDRRVLETGEPDVVSEVQVVDGKGEERLHYVKKWPLKNDHGDTIGLVGVIEDITERRHTEKAMLEAQKLETLGVLAGGIAHDFNNLLVSIMGNNSLAKLEIHEEAKVRPFLDKIETAGERAADLCTQLLAYAGKGKFVVSQTNLNEVISEMAELLQVSISKQVTLHVDLHPNPSLVLADATQLRQVVMNLVINGSEAIGEGGGRVSVSTGEIAFSNKLFPPAVIGEPLAPGDYVFIEVADTGQGMNLETVEKIFDPFFSTKFTGRGLGLAAVLGIVRGHGGAMRVKTSPGRGTNFSVFLPKAVKAKADMDRQAEKSRWKGSGVVLVVDDEQEVRHVLDRMLSRLGFQVLQADHGEQGVELFQTHHQDIVLVLLDLTMPGMDGEATLQQLKKINQSVRAIIMSGYSEGDLVARFVGLDPAMILAKPFTIKQLREKLISVFDPISLTTL